MTIGEVIELLKEIFAALAELLEPYFSKSEDDTTEEV